MSLAIRRIVSFTLALGAIGLGGWQASAEGGRMPFPQNYEEGVHYTTVTRGNVAERLFTSRDAIDAIKAGKPVPPGTNVVLADYRDGDLYRYFVMLKTDGSSPVPDGARRAGNWDFQWFNADRTINAGSDSARCISCHRAQEASDYLFTSDRMKAQ